MKIILPPPLETPPPPQSFLNDLMLLTKNQIRVTWNKWRHLPKKTLFIMGFILLWLLIFVFYLGSAAYGIMENVPFELGQGLLSLIFLSGLVAQIFFGITAAFTSFYMSEDLELLFVAPVSLQAVFVVKSLSVFVSNLVITVFFVLLPGVFYGLLFQAGKFFYLLVILVSLGLLTIGTALAELLNLLVMRIVPPHRSKEAVGFIGAVAGILIALMFQIPNMMIGREEQFDVGTWLTGNVQVLKIMNFFPWGWGSKALVATISGNGLSGLGWTLLIFLVGVLLFILASSFIERGFRRGFISLNQGEGSIRRNKKRKEPRHADIKSPQIFTNLLGEDTSIKTSVLIGIWAVAKKDLLYLKRDTREWFGYLTPLIIMAFFIVQYLFSGSESSRASLITVFVLYTVIFSGNMALQSFGREGEADWFFNSVPLAGWPVVLGKLLASVLPTLILMEALLLGTALAIGLSFSVLVAFGIGAVLLSLGSSAIGLFYSINHCRFNPESTRQRIAPGASMIMFIVNLVFISFLALGIIYIFPPTELIAVLTELPPVNYEGGILSAITYIVYLLSRPLLWPNWARMVTGILITGGVWLGVFFGFLAITVRQSQKGFRVEIVTRKKKK
ncbi:MAG: hypothetical protein GXW85_04055 [Clostridia bacterium]|nr:hypothetical protein [Clostridia bacterium]